MANPLKTSFSRTIDDLGRQQQPQLLHAELVNILRGYSRSKRTLVGANIVKRRSELGRDQPTNQYHYVLILGLRDKIFPLLKFLPAGHNVLSNWQF